MTRLPQLGALLGHRRPQERPATAIRRDLAEQFRLLGHAGMRCRIGHRDSDRARTEKEARAQCSNPYVIAKGSKGGVIMHVADEKEPEELFLKTSGGKTYLGPPGPAPMAEDREMASNDGRVMIMKFMDPDVIKRYGTSIYVRCGA